MRKRKFNKLPPLRVGDRVGNWEIVEIIGPDVKAKCQCGVVLHKRATVLRHHTPKQCRQCLLAERRAQPWQLANLKHSQVWQVMQSLTEGQRDYAARLIRSRQQIEGETLTRSDVIEAVEMALLLTPEQLADELSQLTPRFTVEARQTYTQYQTVKGYL